MPEIRVEQGDGFCHIELLLSQHHSQKDDIAHTEGTQTLMKGNLNIESVFSMSSICFLSKTLSYCQLSVPLIAWKLKLILLRSNLRFKTYSPHDCEKIS